MDGIFFNSWPAIEHSAIIAACGYIALVVMTRISGNRTLSRMTAFDFIVAVTLGSLFGRTILSAQDSLAQFVVGFGVLLILQTILAKASARSKSFYYAVTPTPKFIYRDGAFDRKQMSANGVTESEVQAAVREAGLRDLGDVEAVVLETHGQLSVVWRGATLSRPSLASVAS